MKTKSITVKCILIAYFLQVKARILEVRNVESEHEVHPTSYDMQMNMTMEAVTVKSDFELAADVTVDIANATNSRDSTMRISKVFDDSVELVSGTPIKVLKGLPIGPRKNDSKFKLPSNNIHTFWDWFLALGAIVLIIVGVFTCAVIRNCCIRRKIIEDSQMTSVFDNVNPADPGFESSCPPPPYEFTPTPFPRNENYYIRQSELKMVPTYFAEFPMPPPPYTPEPNDYGDRPMEASRSTELRY